jgi:signal transduction histidine kinase
MDITHAEIESRIQRAKLDALKELAYGASHEINNPLANISARAQALLRDEVDPERRRALLAIRQQAMRAHEMISDLMLFARPPELTLESVDYSSLLRQLVDESAEVLAERQIELAFAVDDATPVVEADAQQLHIALAGIVRNSMEAIDRSGALAIRVRPAAHEDALQSGQQAACCIDVSDDGPGFSEQALQHAFDPFFSGREAGRGLGFGLSKCWRIVTQHGGDVRIENLPTRGARVTLLLTDRPPRIELDSNQTVSETAATDRTVES